MNPLFSQAHTSKLHAAAVRLSLKLSRCESLNSYPALTLRHKLHEIHVEMAARRKGRKAA